MGRFAEESHADLRDWYVHCLDFRALKRRLIDDPPDPFDDHPSITGGSSRPSSSPADTAASANRDSTGGNNLYDTELEQQQALLTAEGGGVADEEPGKEDASNGGGVGGGGGGGGGRRIWGDARFGGRRGGGGISELACPDPASRVFVFEINEELERMWAFYRNESDQCALKLTSLQDTSASLRHQLYRKLGGAWTKPAVNAAAAAAAAATDHHRGAGGDANGSDPPSASTASSLLGEADLQRRSPVVSSGGVLRPTPEEHFLVAGSGGNSRIRGRRPSSSLPGSTQQQGEDPACGWASASSITPPPSSPDVVGGMAKAKALGGGGDGGHPFKGDNGVDVGAGIDNTENTTTEDPYVQASLKRSIVELYDNCHRLLSFKMLNYDAFVRLVELHCRRSGASKSDRLRGAASSRPPWPAKMTAAVGGGGGDSNGGDGVGDAGGAVGAGGLVGSEGVSPSQLWTGVGGPLTKEKAMKVWLLEQPLFSARDLNRTLAGAELLYASLFCNGDVDVARTSLTFKASSSLRGNRRFDFGYRLGAASVLLAWAVWDCIADDSLGKDVWHDPAFKIYRGLGNLVLLVYMWGVNIWVWRRFGIDYERCLSLDPKGPRVDPCEQVWNAGCNLSIAFLVSFICFYKCLRGVLLNPLLVPIQFAHTFPLLLLFYMLLCFLTPWHERKGLLWVLWTTIISPFGKVRFLEGYVGDILTSVVRVLIDVAFAFLYFLSGVRGWLGNSLDLSDDPISSSPWFSNLLVPLLMVAPLWWRFQQNIRRSYETRQRWPHLGNALKYATAMSVSLFGTFQPQMKSSWVWVFCFVYATLYQFTWDVLMDWDLLRWDGKSLRFRPRLLYRNKSIYAGVAIANLLLRFLWTVTLVPENAPNLFPHDFQIYLSPFIAAAEIVRRTMWGFLRVENEHLRIYGSGGTADGSESPDPAEKEGFKHIPSNGTLSTMAGGSSINSNVSSSAASAGGSGGLGGVSIGRASGLDRLPYTRMGMPSGGGGDGVWLSRLTKPIQAWCLIRVKREARCRLLTELCLFSAALVFIGFLAGLS